MTSEKEKPVKEFPFEMVYDHFAKKLVAEGLKEEMMAPMGVFVGIESHEIGSIEAVPSELMNHFFDSVHGKEALSRFIAFIMEQAPENGCFVMISEAYYRKKDKPRAEEIKKISSSSLADDPEADECVLIVIHRPEGPEVGMLPIMADRSLKYQPLVENAKFSGRLAGSNYAKPASH